jgi:hypothetical protein
MALRLDPKVRDPIAYYMLMLDRVRERADEFDILHFHIDQFHFPVFRPLASRTIATLHGRQDLPDLQALYFGFDDIPLVSISNGQRAAIPKANIVATVYHGLPRDLHRPTFKPRGGYLAFLGRISPEKSIDRAAKVDRADEAYFRDQIAPLFKGPGVEFIGAPIESVQ